jgi:hypothetical protein
MQITNSLIFSNKNALYFLLCLIKNRKNKGVSAQAISPKGDLIMDFLYHSRK